jgi:hypothetical protein
VSRRRTRLVGGLRPRFSSHPLDSLVRLLEDVVAVRLELAHYTVIGVDRDLFLPLDLQQGRMLLDNLVTVSGRNKRADDVHRTRLEKTFIGRCSKEADNVIPRQLKPKV